MSSAMKTRLDETTRQKAQQIWNNNLHLVPHQLRRESIALIYVCTMARIANLVEPIVGARLEFLASQGTIDEQAIKQPLLPDLQAEGLVLTFEEFCRQAECEVL